MRIKVMMFWYLLNNLYLLDVGIYCCLWLGVVFI